MRALAHGAAAARLAYTLGCAALLLACGSAAGRAPVAATSPADLHDRPLQLPQVQQGAPCPASPQVTVPAQPAGVTKGVPNYAFGSGPAYLSGQISWYAGAPGQAALILVNPDYSGPVLVRARRVDGSGSATLTNIDIAAANRATGMLAPGTVGADGVEVQVPPPSVPGLWRQWLGRLTADNSGCYALQVDGTSFSTVIVFVVQPGPIPAG